MVPIEKPVCLVDFFLMKYIFHTFSVMFWLRIRNPLKLKKYVLKHYLVCIMTNSILLMVSEC